MNAERIMESYQCSLTTRLALYPLTPFQRLLLGDCDWTFNIRNVGAARTMAMVLLYVSLHYSMNLVINSFSLIDLNLPICAVSAILTVLFFNFNAPRGSVREKLIQLDWM